MVSSTRGSSDLSVKFSVQMVHPSGGNWGQFSMREASSPFWYCCRVICRGKRDGLVHRQQGRGGQPYRRPGETGSQEGGCESRREGVTQGAERGGGGGVTKEGGARAGGTHIPGPPCWVWWIKERSCR